MDPGWRSTARISSWQPRLKNGPILEQKRNSIDYAERLQVDYVDLWQMHFLVEEDDWQTAMGSKGALEAFIEAKEQGLVRFLGVTGHEIRVTNFHKRSLERYDFDSVLLPYSPVLLKNQVYADSFENLISVCQERNVAIQTIKSISRGPWKDKQKKHATWYEPYEVQAHIDAIVHWVLSRPGIFLNTVGDIYLLPKVLDAVQRFDEDVLLKQTLRMPSHRLKWNRFLFSQVDQKLV